METLQKEVVSLPSDEIFGTYIENLPTEIQEAVKESYEEVLKEKANQVLSDLQNSTPRGETSELAASLKMKKLAKTKKQTKIGYKIIYDGYDSKGRPYQVIANSLNRGFVNPQGVHIQGKNFIDQAVSRLKGIDEDIAKRFDKKIAEKEKTHS